jgi:hypothetical protein
MRDGTRFFIPNRNLHWDPAPHLQGGVDAVEFASRGLNEDGLNRRFTFPQQHSPAEEEATADQDGQEKSHDQKPLT